MKDWVYVSRSTIEDAEWGLFASKTFNPGDIISVYFGIPIKNAKESDSEYLFERVIERDGEEEREIEKEIGRER